MRLQKQLQKRLQKHIHIKRERLRERGTDRGTPVTKKIPAPQGLQKPMGFGRTGWLQKRLQNHQQV